MVGILLMTHAPLGQAFIAACAHVFRGPTERFEAIDVVADQDLAEAITYRRDTLDVVVEMALAGAQSGAVRVDNRIRVGE